MIHIKMLVVTTEERIMEDPLKFNFTFIPIILIQFEFFKLVKKVKGRKKGEREERVVEEGRTYDWLS